MIKILQICNKAPYPANDGSSIAIYNMSCGLIANDVDLHLLTINTKKHFKPDENIPGEFKMKSKYQSVYKNTNLKFFEALLNIFSHRSYFVSRFYFKEFENNLIQKLIQNQFDIIQIEGLFMCTYIETIKKYSKAKIVLRAHNIEHFIWKRHIQQEKKWFKKFYLGIQNKRLKEFELDIFSKVDALVTITEKDKLEFTKLGFTKPIEFCITGVDIKFYQSKMQIVPKQKTIFYFGSMDWLPNQEAVTWFLDNCWETVHSKFPESKLIIAGRGMPLEFFHINKPNVLLIENVENGKEFYLQNEIMIVPLWSGSGLRIKIIEGMAYGKAIVSTSIGAEGINYTHQKNILIADSAKEFSEQVMKLLSSEQQRKDLEEQAKLFAAEEFDNMKVVSNLIKFYTKFLYD